MVRRIAFLIIVFYFLSLIQTSFLAHFSLWGVVPNLVFIIAVFINFFNFPQYQKLFSAFIAGLYLDIFSLSNTFGFFGFYTLLLLGSYFILKIISEKYVRFYAVSKK